MNHVHGAHPATRGRAPLTPRRARRVRVLAAAIVIAGSGLTACGGSGGSGSSGSTASGSGSGANARGAAETKAVKFAECMRKNGVPDFPDPVDGRIVFTRKKGEGGPDPDSPQFKAAQERCKQFAPQNEAGAGGNDARMLKFVQCMRRNGVPNFPDPQNGRILMKPGQGVDPDSPQFKAAQKTCQKELPGGTSGGTR